jgi:hypothetical protein
MIAEGSIIVKHIRPRLLTARSTEISLQLSSILWETSDRPLDAAQFVRYLLAVLPRAATRGEKQPDALEEVV